MQFRVGDIVSRKSYQNDILFKIIDISDSIVTLKGVDLRLYADSDIDDLRKEETYENSLKTDREITNQNLKSLDLNRDEYFYLPGKILHIDADIHLSNYDKTFIKYGQYVITEFYKNV